MTTFSTDQYQWSDVTIQIGTRVLTGVQSIRYKESQEKGYVFGKGNKPLSIQRGNYTYEGSVKLLQSELELLIAGAPNRRLGDYRGLTITVAYEKADGQALTDILVGVEFMDYEKMLDQGKQYMEIELPIMFLDIKNNA